ncbi:uncharacterized protein LOC112139807 [Oryzias melastigma]|uniref:uncharacterized protein LOC112139807 n=1 Tax=Oryzias melastigma TaxID=30732 RepID=UPI000CF804E6|nr:uncharacterized protein LOC112139807 [Oryzias melastigma]
MSGIQFQRIDSTSLPQGLSYLNTPKPRDGRTYVMYHGTTGANAGSIRNNGFRRSSNGMLGPGVYLSRDLEKARRYPIDHPDEDRVIIKVKVNVGRVIVIKYQNHHLQQTWSSNGYDSAWVPPNCGMVNSGLEENCIWDPSRIQVIEIIKPKLLRAPSLTPSLTRSQASSLTSSMSHFLSHFSSPLWGFFLSPFWSPLPSLFSSFFYLFSRLFHF